MDSSLVSMARLLRSCKQSAVFDPSTFVWWSCRRGRGFASSCRRGFAVKPAFDKDRDLDEAWLRSWWRLGFFRGSKFATGYSAVASKRLDSIMKLDSVRHASPEDITSIWNEYHLGRGHISAVMSSPLFKALQQRAAECPLFVIPLWRGDGFVSILLQAQMPHILFTSLEDYRVRGIQASPYFTVTHYEELSESKGLVLVRGDIVFTSKLSDIEAKNLLEISHSLYLNDSRFRLVREFNKHSEDFDFKEVLKELGHTP